MLFFWLPRLLHEPLLHLWVENEDYQREQQSKLLLLHRLLFIDRKWQLGLPHITQHMFNYVQLLGLNRMQHQGFLN